MILNVFHPDRGGGAAVFSDMCFALAERGFDVTVRCAYPYYPEWEDKSGRNGLRVQRYTDRGVNVERFGIFIPRNPQSLAQRMIYEGSFLFSLLRSLPRHRDFDAAMVYCPLVGAVAFAKAHRLIHRTPTWLNVQDLSAHAAAASGISRAPVVNRLLERIQGWLFNSTQVWSSISPVMIQELETIRRRGQPILYLPNWLNESLSREISRYPDKTGRAPGRPIKLLYAGNIGDKQALLEFCRHLQHSPASFDFHIHGDGSVAPHVARWIDAHSDPRFTFGPFLSEADFARALHESDLFVITEKSKSGGAFIPSKMIPGMASQTPILAICDADGPLGMEMHEAQPGYWLPWERVDEVGRLLDELGNDPDGFANRQRNASTGARVYDRGTVLDRLERQLRAFASGDPMPDS